MDIATAQYLAALDVLGLNPDTTLSVNLSPDWFRVVHTDQSVESGPLAPAATDDAQEGAA